MNQTWFAATGYAFFLILAGGSLPLRVYSRQNRASARLCLEYAATPSIPTKKAHEHFTYNTSKKEISRASCQKLWCPIPLASELPTGGKLVIPARQTYRCGKPLCQKPFLKLHHLRLARGFKPTPGKRIKSYQVDL